MTFRTETRYSGIEAQFDIECRRRIKFHGRGEFSRDLARVSPLLSRVRDKAGGKKQILDGDDPEKIRNCMLP